MFLSHTQNVVSLDDTTKKSMFNRVGSCKIQPSFRSGSVSLVSKGEGGPSVFYLLNISKCSGPPRPIPFGQSLSISTTIRLSTYRKSCSSVTGHILGIQSRRRLMSNLLYSARDAQNQNIYY